MRLFGRRDTQPRDDGLMDHEVHELAAYNGRVAQGIVHTSAYAERMAVLQHRFDETQRARNVAAGYIEIPSR